ncbi:MAG: hypothetical protein HY617_01355 [Candidatus Sungbacteria bacterium]|nr:hypothetical protein [Candidatus Sungbacteria bacterium]
MLRIKTMRAIFDCPTVIFTLRGNRLSEQAIEEFRKIPNNTCKAIVFDNVDAMYGGSQCDVAALDQGIAFFDVKYASRGRYKMYTVLRERDRKIMPAWSQIATWGVGVTQECKPQQCAEQIYGSFLKYARQYLERGWFPWGSPQKRDTAPVRVVLPAGMDGLVQRLNAGPDLAATAANSAHALELPQGSRISWVRVAGNPVGCDYGRLSDMVGALARFEEVSQLLVEANPEVRQLLLFGVDMPLKEELGSFYLHPRHNHFSVDRADLHYTGNTFFASEVDEMPGGFGELVHLDHSYGVNQDRWHACFSSLTSCGGLLFVVSDRWSECYIEETRWLAAHMRHLGYDARVATTAELCDMTIGSDVRFCGAPVGTVWRLFPIFETDGKLAELVRAAHDGKVRMIPEFAHFGNKVWFSLFRKFEQFFRQHLSDKLYAFLSELLPDSHLIVTGAEFPCSVAGFEIKNLHALYELPRDMRDNLVLKVCGANPLTARSYGVLMGHGLRQDQWKQWIGERIRANQPFIVQRRVPTAVMQLPVRNTKNNRPELFSCRVLVRPWVIDGLLVSASCVAVPSDTMRVHGRVDMAMASVVFN